MYFQFFEKPFRLFSIATAPIYIPTNRAQMFPSLHILTKPCYLLSFLIIANLTHMRWYLNVLLIFISMVCNVEHIFMHLLGIYMCPSETVLNWLTRTRRGRLYRAQLCLHQTWKEDLNRCVSKEDI